MSLTLMKKNISCLRRRTVKERALAGSNQQTTTCDPASVAQGRWKAASDGALMVLCVVGCYVYGIWADPPNDAFYGTLSGTTISMVLDGRTPGVKFTATASGKTIIWDNGDIWTWVSGLTAAYAPAPALSTGQWHSFSSSYSCVLYVVGNAVYGLYATSPLASFIGITIGTTFILADGNNGKFGDVSTGGTQVYWSFSNFSDVWTLVSGLTTPLVHAQGVYALANPAPVLLAGRWNTGGGTGSVSVIGNAVCGLSDASPPKPFSGVVMSTMVILNFADDASQDNTWVGNVTTDGKQISWTKLGSTATATWSYISGFSAPVSPAPVLLPGQWNAGGSSAAVSLVGNVVSGTTHTTPPGNFGGVATGSKVIIIFSGPGSPWVGDVSADGKQISWTKFGATDTSTWTFVSAWTRVFKCNNGNASVNRLDYTPAQIEAMANTATQVKICTMGSNTDCEISNANTFPIQMLQLGNAISANNGVPCDQSCVSQTWTGPRAGNMWSSCASLPPTNGQALTGGGGALVYQACGNYSGLHLSGKDGDLCGWIYTNTAQGPGDNIEVFINTATPV